MAVLFFLWSVVEEVNMCRNRETTFQINEDWVRKLGRESMRLVVWSNQHLFRCPEE